MQNTSISGKAKVPGAPGGSSTGIAPSAAKAALERTKWQKGRESIIIHIINWERKERRAPYLGIFRASL